MGAGAPVPACRSVREVGHLSFRVKEGAGERASFPLTGSRTQNRLAPTPAERVHRRTHLGSQGELLTCSPPGGGDRSGRGVVRLCTRVSCHWTGRLASLNLGLFTYETGIGSELFWLTNEKSEILSMEPPAPSPLPFSSSVPGPPPGLPKRPQQSPPAMEINHYPLREFGTSLLPPRPLPLALKARHTQVVKLPVRSVYMSLMDPTWCWSWSQRRCPHHPWCPTAAIACALPPSAPMSHPSPYNHGYPTKCTKLESSTPTGGGAECGP